MLEQENRLTPTTPPPETPPYSPWHWGWAATLAVITLVTLAFRYALPVRDGDLWFHMLYGKYFLEHKTLIADHTIFSWTPTTNDTIYCTWLPDIFLYLLHKIAGLPGIFAFRYLCMLVPVLGCFLYARKLRIANNPLTWLLCLLAVIMSYTAAFDKPEILSFVFMTLLAWNWWHIRSSGEEAWKSCYLFPIIMLVWVNTHGGFVFGAVFLVLIWLGEMGNTWLSPQNTLSPKVRKHLTIALFVAVFTTLLNPYGYHYPLQLFFDLLPTEANTTYNQKIAAYDSPFIFEDTYIFVLGADMVIAILLLLSLRNFKKIEWSSLLANLFFAYLYTRFFRTTFYWVPVFLFSGLYLLSLAPVVPPQWKYAIPFSRKLPALVTIAAILLAGLSLYNSSIKPERLQWMGFGISDGNPVTEAEYIKKYFPHARIGNTYDQGAYLMWKLWPENTVFFDARHFPYRNWSDSFFNFMSGKNIKEMTQRYPCDLWCVGHLYPDLAMGLLLSKDWHLAFYGKNCAIIIRRDIPLPQDAPRISNDINDPKNITSALDTVRFATNIGDFETAQQIVDAMKKKFFHKTQGNVLRWASYYFDGVKAYEERDYAMAAGKLRLIADPPEYIRYILTNCFQFLTQKAWIQNDLSTAMKFAQKSLELVPDNSYTLYNIGIIGWRQEKENKNAQDLLMRYRNTKNWRMFLEQFVQQAKDDRDFMPYKETATAVLHGQQSKYPQLLIPPEPINRKLF
jgi:hypothetical protein